MIQGLPNELYLMILGDLSELEGDLSRSESLAACSLANRNLRSISIPLLYQVMAVDVGETGRDLEALRAFLRSHPSLAPRVRRLKLCTRNDDRGRVELKLPLLFSIMKLLPNLETLRLFTVAISDFESGLGEVHLREESTRINLRLLVLDGIRAHYTAETSELDRPFPSHLRSLFSLFGTIDTVVFCLTGETADIGEPDYNDVEDYELDVLPNLHIRSLTLSQDVLEEKPYLFTVIRRLNGSDLNLEELNLHDYVLAEDPEARGEFIRTFFKTLKRFILNTDTIYGVRNASGHIAYRFNLDLCERLREVTLHTTLINQYTYLDANFLTDICDTIKLLPETIVTNLELVLAMRYSTAERVVQVLTDAGLERLDEHLGRLAKLRSVRIAVHVSEAAGYHEGVEDLRGLEMQLWTSLSERVGRLQKLSSAGLVSVVCLGENYESQHP